MTESPTNPDSLKGVEDHSTDRGALLRAIRVLIAIMIATYAVGIFTNKIDADEVQYLAAGWHVSQGEQLYTEVWDTHGPMMVYLLAGGMRLLRIEGPPIYFVYRAAMFLLQMGLLAIFFRWVRRLFPERKLIAELAVLFLLYSIIFAHKGLEIRADNPLHFLWMVSLLLWFRALDGDRLRDFFLSGLVMGAGFLFTIKTVLVGGAIGMMFFAAMRTERRWLFKQMAILGLGASIAPALLYAWLQFVGSFDEFWSSTLRGLPVIEVRTGNPTLESREFAAAGIIVLNDPGDVSALWLYMLALVYAGIRILRKKAPPVLKILWIGVLTLLFEYAWVLPDQYHQSYLTILPLGMALVTWSVLDVAGFVRRRRPTGTIQTGPGRFPIVLLMLYTLAVILMQGFYQSKPAREFLSRERAYLEEIEPGAYVFDTYGSPITRPHPLRMKSFVKFARDLFRYRFLSPRIIPGNLDEKDVIYVINDARMGEFGSVVSRFIRENYLPMKTYELMAAGMSIEPEPDGGARFVIRIAADYWWKVTPGENKVILDGSPPPNPVYLEDGSHTVEWDGDGTLYFSSVSMERLADPP